MTEIKQYSTKRYLRAVAHYVSPYRRKFFVGVLFRLTSDLARLYPALAISQIVLILSGPQALKSTNQLLLIFISWGIITIYYGFAHNFSKYFGYQVAEKASLEIYKDCLAHIFKLDYSWQETENSGNKMKRVDKGADGVNITIRRIFDTLIQVLVNTVGIVLVFFTVNSMLAFALIFYMVIYYAIGTILLKRAVKQEQIVNKAGEDLGGITFEALNNIQTIKALAIDQGVKDIVYSQIEDLFIKIKRRILLFQSQAGALLTYRSLFEFGTIAVISWGIYSGHYNVSLLVLFVNLFSKVSGSIDELTDVTQQLALAKIWISRAMGIMDTPLVIEHPEKVAGQKQYPADWKKIRINNVHFSYHKKDALKSVSLTINRGEKVGIVGLSGSGKSTLFKLLLDLYEDYDGDINIDGISLKDMQRQSYIDHVAVVLQDTELFDMTLKENIKIASVAGQTTGPLFIHSIIKMAHLEDVVKQLPQGLNTIVGEKGIRLSGGQRQRVGIARALYRQPDILLLDEATSHLDAHSEQEIQKALQDVMKKYTTIVVAHRLSTIKAMDKIVVLGNGKVLEQGNFSELLAKKGAFAQMWSEQKI